MKQTAVEWLRKQIILNSKLRETKTGKISFTISLSMLDKLQREAEEMEKEQIIKAYEYTAAGTSHYGEQYYNETFNK